MSGHRKKTLVTGGAGLIGSHLVDLLIEKGHEVTVLDNLEPQTHPLGKPAWINPSAHFISGDVRNESHLRQALRGVRSIFHQAAFGGFSQESSKYIDVNVNGTSKLFELIQAEKFPVEKIVVASSQAVYGEGAYECDRDGLQFPSSRPMIQLQEKQWEPVCPHCRGKLKVALTSEEKPRQGETPYALSKEFEERLALSCGAKLGIPVVALRYGVTYGPRQSLFNPYTGVISIFSNRFLNNLSPLVYEDGRQFRDFVFVGDVARANLFVMENELANGQVFNVGSGKGTTITDLAQTLAVLYGKSIEPEIPGQFRWGDARHILLDSSKLKRLGFSPLTELKEGLGRFSEWLGTQQKVADSFARAYENLKKGGVVYG